MPTQLLLTYDFPPMQGGIARWMEELAKNYPPGSLVVSTGQYDNSAGADRLLPNQVDRLATGSQRLRTLQGLIRWAKRAAVLARSHDIEFTWCGNLRPAGYPARWVAARVGIPYGVLVHGGDLLLLRQKIERSAFKHRTARALLRRASVLVANSRWTADLCRTVLEALGLKTSLDRVRVVPLGSDPQHFRPGIDPSVVRARYVLDHRRWLLTVARLTRHKGVDTGLQVLARLRDRYPDLGYAIVGSGGDLPRLERLAQQLGVSERVRFLTGVPDSDLPALYNSAEIYLGLSRQTEGNAEGFGISLVEAGACGLPVVGGRSGGIPDAVREGETGLLVDSEAVEEIATSVSRLLEDRALAERLGANGRRAVETHYNWKRVADDLARVGHELAAATRPCLQDAR